MSQVTKEFDDPIKYIISEIYIRDHLLIQWMIEYKERYLFDRTSSIEDIYKDWTRWLKEREEAHGERSKV